MRNFVLLLFFIIKEIMISKMTINEKEPNWVIILKKGVKEKFLKKVKIGTSKKKSLPFMIKILIKKKSIKKKIDRYK